MELNPLFKYYQQLKLNIRFISKMDVQFFYGQDLFAKDNLRILIASQVTDPPATKAGGTNKNYLSSETTYLHLNKFE